MFNFQMSTIAWNATCNKNVKEMKMDGIKMDTPTYVNVI